MSALTLPPWVTNRPPQVMMFMIFCNINVCLNRYHFRGHCMVRPPHMVIMTCYSISVCQDTSSGFRLHCTVLGLRLRQAALTHFNPRLRSCMPSIVQGSVLCFNARVALSTRLCSETCPVYLYDCCCSSLCAPLKACCCGCLAKDLSLDQPLQVWVDCHAPVGFAVRVRAHMPS